MHMPHRHDVLSIHPARLQHRQLERWILQQQQLLQTSLHLPKQITSCYISHMSSHIFNDYLPWGAAGAAEDPTIRDMKRNRTRGDMIQVRSSWASVFGFRRVGCLPSDYDGNE